MAPSPTISLSGRLRGFLDVMATCGMLIASGAILFHFYGRDVEPRAAEPPALPGTPIDIAESHRRGDENAPVVLLEFGEFLCPFCQKFAQTTLPAIIRDYVDTGHVMFVYRHLPLEGLHPIAPIASAAAECAATRGQFWRAHDLIFDEERPLSRPILIELAQSLDLDRGEFESCIDAVGAERVRVDQAAAAELGIQSTPYFLIGRRDPRGRLRATHVLRGAKPLAAFAAALNEALADK